MTERTTPWHDRFTRPSVEGLLACLEEGHRAAFEAAREALSGLPGVREELVHMGVPWRWCLRYTTEGDDRFAFLVPEPGKPLLSLPLPEAFLEGLPLRRLSRGVRDGLTHARLVGGVVWAEWELTSRTQAEELTQLAQQKHGAGAGER